MLFLMCAPSGRTFGGPPCRNSLPSLPLACRLGGRKYNPPALFRSTAGLLTTPRCQLADERRHQPPGVPTRLREVGIALSRAITSTLPLEPAPGHLTRVGIGWTLAVLRSSHCPIDPMLCAWPLGGPRLGGSSPSNPHLLASLGCSCDAGREREPHMRGYLRVF